MLYKLNTDTNREIYAKVKRVTLADIGWKEKDLEKLLSHNIIDFISSNDLMTIFTERPRQEEPDILALDKDGDLYIFELKRWSGKRENLLQVLRYGQLFGKSNYDELNSIYQKYNRNCKSSLIESHTSYFSWQKAKALNEDDFNRKQHFIVVANGVDQQTVEAIIYWKSVGLNIDAIIYWVFEIAGEYYIEFNTYSQIADYLEYENNYYVLNTDFRNSPSHHDSMLNERKAAAYNTGWKEKITKLQKDDTVFLYQSGVGIVAYGKADGKLNKLEENGVKEYEYNMHLNDFVLLQEPISAAKMKEITQYGFNFRQTMFSISEEAAMKIIKNIK